MGCDDRIPTTNPIVVLTHHVDEPFAYVTRVDVGAHGHKAFEIDNVLASKEQQLEYGPVFIRQSDELTDWEAQPTARIRCVFARVGAARKNRRRISERHA